MLKVKGFSLLFKGSLFFVSVYSFAIGSYSSMGSYGDVASHSSNDKAKDPSELKEATQEPNSQASCWSKLSLEDKANLKILDQKLQDLRKKLQSSQISTDEYQEEIRLLQDEMHNLSADAKALLMAQVKMQDAMNAQNGIEKDPLLLSYLKKLQDYRVQLREESQKYSNVNSLSLLFSHAVQKRDEKVQDKINEYNTFLHDFLLKRIEQTDALEPRLKRSLTKEILSSESQVFSQIAEDSTKVEHTALLGEAGAQVIAGTGFTISSIYFGGKGTKAALALSANGVRALSAAIQGTQVAARAASVANASTSALGAVGMGALTGASSGVLGGAGYALLRNSAEAALRAAFEGGKYFCELAGQQARLGAKAQKNALHFALTGGALGALVGAGIAAPGAVSTGTLGLVSVGAGSGAVVSTKAAVDSLEEGDGVAASLHAMDAGLAAVGTAASALGAKASVRKLKEAKATKDLEDLETINQINSNKGKGESADLTVGVRDKSFLLEDGTIDLNKVAEVGWGKFLDQVEGVSPERLQRLKYLLSEYISNHKGKILLDLNPYQGGKFRPPSSASEDPTLSISRDDPEGFLTILEHELGHFVTWKKGNQRTGSARAIVDYRALSPTNRAKQIEYDEEVAIASQTVKDWVVHSDYPVTEGISAGFNKLGTQDDSQFTKHVIDRLSIIVKRKAAEGRKASEIIRSAKSKASPTDSLEKKIETEFILERLNVFPDGIEAYLLSRFEYVSGATPQKKQEFLSYLSRLIRKNEDHFYGVAESKLQSSGNP